VAFPKYPGTADPDGGDQPTIATVNSHEAALVDRAVDHHDFVIGSARTDVLDLHSILI